jgi:ribosomal protein L27
VVASVVDELHTLEDIGELAREGRVVVRGTDAYDGKDVGCGSEGNSDDGA